MGKKTLYISAYNKILLSDIGEMIRTLGRRTQRPIWGRKIEDYNQCPNLLFIDKGGRASGVGGLCELFRVVYTESYHYIDRRFYPVRVFAEFMSGIPDDAGYNLRRLPEAGTLIRERSMDIYKQEPNATFALVESNKLIRSRVFNRIRDYAFELKWMEVQSEFSLKLLAMPEEVKKIDVFLTDIFNQAATRTAIFGAYGPCDSICRAGGVGGNLYVPYTAERNDALVARDPGYENNHRNEIVLSVYTWLIDVGEEKAAKRLFNAFCEAKNDDGNLFRNIIHNLQKPLRRRKNGSSNNRHKK